MADSHHVNPVSYTHLQLAKLTEGLRGFTVRNYITDDSVSGRLQGIGYGLRVQRGDSVVAHKGNLSRFCRLLYETAGILKQVITGINGILHACVDNNFVHIRSPYKVLPQKAASCLILSMVSSNAVSYTHLDVYKRQMDELEAAGADYIINYPNELLTLLDILN